MPVFVTLANFTEQGARTIKDSPSRFEALKSAADAAGVKTLSVHWTSGAYDVVLITEGSEDAVMSLALKTASLGNVRTQTMRGFTLDEMKKFVSRMS